MIFNKIENEKRLLINDLNNFTWTSGDPLKTDELKEVTYFSSIKCISEDIAKCTLQVKKETEKGEVIAKEHYLNDILRLRPNLYMSAIDCIKAFVARSRHEGWSGLFIDRQGLKVNAIYPVRITSCIIDNAGLIRGTKNNKILWDFTSIDGEYGSCFDKDIIVLRDFTLDGIRAKSNRRMLSENLDTSIKSQNYLNTLFTNGLTNKIVIQTTSNISDEKEQKKTQARFDRVYSNNGRVFTVPIGYSVSALNMNLSDSQYEQLRRLSKEEIASSFRVPLSKLGIVRDTAISEEQDNIKYLGECLLVIFEQIEQEMDYKLLTPTERKQGYKIRFNINVLLRTDSKTQAEVITNYVKNGVYDLDLARGLLGVEKLGGEAIISFPSGQVLLKDLLNGNVSYQNNKNINNPDTGGGEK